MEIITLTRVEDPTASRWLTAISADYDVPKDPTVFEVPPTDTRSNGERIAVWVGKDGGGFGAIDGDPAGYVKLSAALERGDTNFRSNHPGVDEYVFEPGEFDPTAETLELKVRPSFF